MNKTITIIIGIIILTQLAYATTEKHVLITKNPHYQEPQKKGYGIQQELQTTTPTITITHHYNSFEGMSATVTQEEYEQLQQNPRYLIQESKIFHITLDVSVPHLQANWTWKLQDNNQNNITGIGQTVCIIDTGVNYTHQAFGGCYGNNNASSNCTIIGGWDYVNNDEDPMDDQGHGTHVTGIVASNDATYRGVAPGTKIIMIKALDAGGSGFDSDIIAGIDWCTQNATTYNISVISMSLSDCTNYTNYCDADYAAWTASINAATAKNITVVAAAGNGPFGICSGAAGLGTLNGPSSPACIQNATAIGGVDDSDIPYVNFQRGTIFELMAPSISIISTLYTGGFGGNGGTSMATPHAAGTIALIQQASKTQTGTIKTPDFIKYLLNTTGLVINDTLGTNLNYTRINAYQPILAIDTTTPITNLSTPQNETVDPERDINFTCNTTDWQLNNITLYLWNETGIYYNETRNITGTSNSTTFNLSNMLVANYSWNCETNDAKGNKAFQTTGNYTITAGGLPIGLMTPNNNTKTNNPNQTFTCNATTAIKKHLTNMTLNIWNSTGIQQYNSTTNITGTTNTSTNNYTLPTEGTYYWNCQGVNNETEQAYAIQNYTITYDNTTPTITNNQASSTTTTITITWNTNEETNTSITGELSGTNSSYSQNHTHTISSLTPLTEYTYTITSCDRTGNCANTEQTTTTTSTNSGGGSGGGSSGSSGGGGGSGPITYTVSPGELNKGIQKILLPKEKIQFDIGTETHTLTLNNITGTTTNITIESETINTIIKQGEEQKFSLSNNQYYDLLIKIVSIGTNKATIYLKRINEEKTPIIQEENKTNITETTKTTQEEKKNPTINIIAVIILTISIAYIIEEYLKNKRIKKKQNKEQKKKQQTII